MTGSRALSVSMLVAGLCLTACGGASARSQACRRLGVAQTDYAALRTHTGQADFAAEVQVYASELGALVKAGSRVNDPQLNLDVTEAQSAFAASAADATAGNRPSQLLVDERRFAFAMTEAGSRCQGAARIVPPTQTFPRQPTTTRPGP